MGPAPHGPGFAAPPRPPERPDHDSVSDVTPVGRVTADQFALPRSRWPNVLSAALIGMVVGVVVLATVWADRTDRVGTWSRPTVTRAPAAPVAALDPRSVEFTTDTGTGRLRVVRHSWDAGQAEPPQNGSYLQVTVEVVAETGSVDYDADNFEAFDADGGVFEVVPAGASGALLGIGTLSAGERVRGLLTFDLPRGAVTLLMSETGSTAVTAIRVAD